MSLFFFGWCVPLFFVKRPFIFSSKNLSFLGPQWKEISSPKLRGAFQKMSLKKEMRQKNDFSFIPLMPYEKSCYFWLLFFSSTTASLIRFPFEKELGQTVVVSLVCIWPENAHWHKINWKQDQLLVFFSFHSNAMMPKYRRNHVSLFCHPSKALLI